MGAVHWGSHPTAGEWMASRDLGDWRFILTATHAAPGSAAAVLLDDIRAQPVDVDARITALLLDQKIELGTHRVFTQSEVNQLGLSTPRCAPHRRPCHAARRKPEATSGLRIGLLPGLCPQSRCQLVAFARWIGQVGVALASVGFLGANASAECMWRCRRGPLLCAAGRRDPTVGPGTAAHASQWSPRVRCATRDSCIRIR